MNIPNPSTPPCHAQETGNTQTHISYCHYSMLLHCDIPFGVLLKSTNICDCRICIKYLYMLSRCWCAQSPKQCLRNVSSRFGHSLRYKDAHIHIFRCCDCYIWWSSQLQSSGFELKSCTHLLCCMGVRRKAGLLNGLFWTEHELRGAKINRNDFEPW